MDGRVLGWVAVVPPIPAILARLVAAAQIPRVDKAWLVSIQSPRLSHCIQRLLAPIGAVLVEVARAKPWAAQREASTVVVFLLSPTLPPRSALLFSCRHARSARPSHKRALSDSADRLTD